MNYIFLYSVVLSLFESFKLTFNKESKHHNRETKCIIPSTVTPVTNLYKVSFRVYSYQTLNTFLSTFNDMLLYIAHITTKYLLLVEKLLHNHNCQVMIEMIQSHYD